MLTIIGNGEHAAVIRDAANEQWYIARRTEKEGSIIGIGNPIRRRHVATTSTSCEWITVVHPSATVSEKAVLFPGVFVGSGAVINTGAQIGQHAIINSGAIVEHDVTVGEFVNVNPGVAIGGGARIGDGTVLGLGCRVRDHITIGRNVTVGMGAVVVCDVPDGVTVIGCPAREMLP